MKMGPFERMYQVYFMHDPELNAKILHKEKALPYSYGQLNDLYWVYLPYR